MKKLRYGLEALFIYIVFFIFRLLPLDLASACGGWLGRTFVPSRIALINLRLAGIPGDHRAIVRAMGDNLGRVFAEYPHIERIARERVEIVNPQLAPPPGTAAMAFTGHLANWEVMASACHIQLGLTFDNVYRAPNNPWVAKILSRARSLGGKLKGTPKSRTSARDFIDSITHGRPVGILIDQKYNEGVAVPFFGRPAMTSTAFVKIPQKYDCPLIPCRIERLQGAHFRLTFCDPIPVRDRPAEDIVADAHKLLENWIREKPGQWLWLHRRWPKENYSS